MSHFLFFVMTICMIIGIATLTFTILTYFKIREKFIITVFLFYISLTLPPIYEIISIYFNLSDTNFFINNLNLFHFISIVLTYLSLFFIIYLTNSIVDIKHNKLVNSLCLLAVISCLVLSYFSSTFVKTDLNIYVSTYYKYSWLDYSQVIPVLYLASLFIIRYKLKKELFKSWLGKRLSLTILISIPFLLIDIFKLVSNLFFFLPLIYIGISVQILLYLKKVYKIKEININNLGLTEREKELVQLIIKGQSNTEISENLHISISTVKNHIYNIYKKLNIKNRYELINKVSG